MGSAAIKGLNLTFPVARYGVGLSFREVFGIEFCDTPQLAAGSFISCRLFAEAATRSGQLVTISSNSTSKTKVAPGLMVGGDPPSP